MERLYVWLNLNRDLWKSMLQAMSKLNLLEYLARKMILLILILILAEGKNKEFSWTPDSAVIVHSQGGRLGVIGWGANCFCLTKIAQINGTKIAQINGTLNITSH